MRVFLRLFVVLFLCCAVSSALPSFSAAQVDDARIMTVSVQAARGEAGPIVATYSTVAEGAIGPKPLLKGDIDAYAVALAAYPESKKLCLYALEEGGRRVVLRQSEKDGAAWSAPVTVLTSEHAMMLGNAVATEEGIAIGVSEATDDGLVFRAAVSRDGASFAESASGILEGAAQAGPVLVSANGALYAYYVYGAKNRCFRVLRGRNGAWSSPEAVNLPYAYVEGNPVSLSIVALDDGALAAVAPANVRRPNDFGILLSYDGGRSWPTRRFKSDSGTPVGILSGAQLVQTAANDFKAIQPSGGGMQLDRAWTEANTKLATEPHIEPLTPPLYSGIHKSTPPGAESVALPIADAPFFEHVRETATASDWGKDEALPKAEDLPGISGRITTPIVSQGALSWVGTNDGLYARSGDAYERYPSYGVEGPLSNCIAGLAIDNRGVLWVATPAGLSSRDSNGVWTLIRGRQGLPWETLTCIAHDGADGLWLGSTRGLIQYRPYAEGRQWYYRSGERFLPDDSVTALKIQSRNALLVRTETGYARIVEMADTLHAKADYFETRLNARFRRLGTPSPLMYDDPYAMTNGVAGPQPSDALWTSYHVAAVCMAYTLTQDERFLASARKSMDAIYLHQNVTGITGLVARSVVAVDEPAAERVKDQDNWHLSPDGGYFWRDDVSSDQIDGHFLAFYTYYEHIAQFDAAASAQLEAQIRMVLDYILDHHYQIIDWDGKRTLWGWWNPELLNDAPIHYLERGLYSLMMLEFLKMAHWVTEDERYLREYRKCIEAYGYLSNIQTQKKSYPDEMNHSDDQLSAISFYPYMALEHNPLIRDVAHRELRRHAFIEQPERNTLMAFVYGATDPDDADILGGIATLREMPRDRRNWRQDNAHRADVVLQPMQNVGGREILLEIVPADERQFERWNQDPYQAQTGGDGRLDGSGEQYLLPYWMGRYHGFIATP